MSDTVEVIHTFTEYSAMLKGLGSSRSDVETWESICINFLEGADGDLSDVLPGTERALALVQNEARSVLDHLRKDGALLAGTVLSPDAVPEFPNNDEYDDPESRAVADLVDVLAEVARLLSRFGDADELGRFDSMKTEEALLLLDHLVSMGLERAGKCRGAWIAA